MSESSWKVYYAGEKADDATLERWLANAPPWRRLGDVDLPVKHFPPATETSRRRGKTYACSTLFMDPGDDRSLDEETQINIALMLRRPLLVTGPPGVGKSSLAYHLAWSLGLGEPLRWEINSRTTLQDGLYSYDAVDHLRAIQEAAHTSSNAVPPLSQFISLGPLGTALLPTRRPRVLLVDELDKASFDLPNDLLHVFEEGEFTIPELLRIGAAGYVNPYDPFSGPTQEPFCARKTVRIEEGRVRSIHHPVVVITSNAEREFPPAFLRRCISLELDLPGDAHMEAIVRNQLGEEFPEMEAAGMADVLNRYSGQATDVILQALYLQHGFGAPQDRVDRGIKRS